MLLDFDTQQTCKWIEKVYKEVRLLLSELRVFIAVLLRLFNCCNYAINPEIEIKTFIGLLEPGGKENINLRNVGNNL
jgi:hypothetical protein